METAMITETTNALEKALNAFFSTISGTGKMIIDNENHPLLSAAFMHFAKPKLVSSEDQEVQDIVNGSVDSPISDYEVIEDAFDPEYTSTRSPSRVSVATALDESLATAFEDSAMTALEDSTATALEESTDTALEDSTATALEDSTATALEESTATALEESTVTALETSTETALEESTATALDESTATALDVSTMTAVGEELADIVKEREQINDWRERLAKISQMPIKDHVKMIDALVAEMDEMWKH